MAAPEHGPDDESIKPVSSLRSRFESLGRDAAAKTAPPLAPKPQLLGPSGAPLKRSTSNTGERIPYLPDAQNESSATSALRDNGSTPLRLRPKSMISTASPQDSAPLVNIVPPSSTARNPRAGTIDLDGQLSTSNVTATRLEVASSIADMPTKMHARTPSRAATPTLGASDFRPVLPVSTPNPSIASFAAGHREAEMRSNSSTTSKPPPVNRAGKPSVPPKPVALVPKSSSLSAPQPSPNEGADTSVSPFSTPPSSSPNSPEPVVAPRLRRVPNGSNGAFTQRDRGFSDASFVERLRSDSDASSISHHRGPSDASYTSTRERTPSTSSAAQPGSLPELHHSWTLPSTAHHSAVTPFRDPVAATAGIATYDRAPQKDGTNLPRDAPDPRPRLPMRPESEVRADRGSPTRISSGRTSPVKGFNLHRSSTPVIKTNQRIPANKTSQRSALTQGFDRAPISTTPTLPTRPQEARSPARGLAVSASSYPATSYNSADIQQSSQLHTLPVVPAPRRSLDRRRDAPMPSATEEPPRDAFTGDGPSEIPASAAAGPSDYPDSSQANRRPPKYTQKPHHLYTDYDTRIFAVCGPYVCTTGNVTKAWDLRTGEQLLSMLHNEMVKVSSIVFKPSPRIEDEGKRIWLGTSIGEIHEIDIASQALVKTKMNAHPRRDIIRMFRYASELWSLDDGGDLNVWKPDSNGLISLDSQGISFRVPRGHTFSIAVGGQLWYATGKDIRVFAPSARSDTDFQLLRAPLSQQGLGEVYSGATLSSKPDLIYFGHNDGKVSIYNRRDFTCAGVVNVSLYKMSALAGVGDYLWAGFHTGTICVYDTSTTPWRVRKEWKAHEKHVCGIVVDRSAMWKLDRLQVVSLGIDNLVKIWDGTLEDDWLDFRMQERDGEYCSFRELTAAVLTWNAGAATPQYLGHSKGDDQFLQTYMNHGEAPDIFVFGFQELVDLEDKKATAKAFFRSKRSEPGDMGQQYRAWRDHLKRSLDDHMPTDQSYTLLHTASLVGLFTCIFVKSPLRSRIKHVHASEVKRGMGGHHGNKGALMVRLVVDDTSVCFINCHLAAGQTQTMNRNHDLAEILEAVVLPPYPLARDGAAQHSDVFTSGGDGSMILDHDICILNGDLNYRIDTMGRDTVIKHITQNNLPRLLERDQLLLSRRKNAGSRLRAFQESEIRFAPTYKYDVRSDEYDTSEKRRAPAWCDRILYRGLGRVRMDDYRRWEVRVSDHRPVSGRLRLRIKTVDAARRPRAWQACQREFELARRRIAQDVQVEHLTSVLGMSQREALAALQS